LASVGSGEKGARASRMLTHRQLHAGMMVVMMSLVTFISACLRGSHKRMISLLENNTTHFFFIRISF